MISADTTAAIEKFTTTVKRAAQARSKDIRLDISDATMLMAEIANVVARLAVYENSTVTEKANTTFQMDGGNLKG